MKLNKFDAAKKVADKLLLYWPVFILMIQVAIIKEIKNLVEGMNLVQVWNANFRHSVLFPFCLLYTSFQAKKFVESAPAVVKSDIAKDEAEKIQAALQAVGGECVVE